MRYDDLYRSLKDEHKRLEQIRRKESQLENIQEEKTERRIRPVLPKFNPLDEVPIYISVENEPLDRVLYIIAQNAGLNLVIQPGVVVDKRVTVTFANVPSSVVLDKIMKAFDLSWEVKDNCLYVKRFVEKEFYLNFLNVKTSVDIAAGGDVFGQSISSNEGEISSSEFKGKFAITSGLGKGLEKDSLYNMVLNSVNSILGKNPISGEMATLDPLTGVLYVKCAPSKMKLIDLLISEMKKKMSKQVVIDAQILEVRLNDSFSLGIDWSYVGRFLINDLGLDVNIGWFKDTGFGTYTFNSQLSSQKGSILIIKDPARTFTEGGKQFRTTVKALQKFGDVKIVSHPHIRVKHAQPAVMVSGKTIKYISEISRDQTEDGGLVTYTVDTSSAFEGVMLGVVPFIINKSTVDLEVFPINSKVDLSNIQVIGDQNIQITLPTVEIRNIATTVRVHNNDTIILGGLIYKTVTKDRSKSPVLSDVPILGWLFKQKEATSSLRELVIIMHIKIL